MLGLREKKARVHACKQMQIYRLKVQHNHGEKGELTQNPLRKTNSRLILAISPPGPARTTIPGTH